MEHRSIKNDYYQAFFITDFDSFLINKVYLCCQIKTNHKPCGKIIFGISISFFQIIM